MYRIYHTEALILGGHAAGEGDRLLSCYTREFGLIAVRVKSLRQQRSRLRYGLQTFAHADIDLVSGKHGWRLTSARPRDSFSGAWRSREKREILAHHARLILRLVTGEERHAELFDDILSGWNYIKVIEIPKLSLLELILVIRLLERLGYFSERAQHAPMFREWGEEMLKYVTVHRKELLVLANHALKETQL